jgi:hypothetical protein
MEESKNAPINDDYFAKAALEYDTSVKPDYEGLKLLEEEEAERLLRKSSSKNRNKMAHLTPKKKKRK